MRQSDEMSLGKGLRFLLGEHATFFRVAATGVATVFMRNWLFEFSMGGGPSMTPTLAERNSVVLDEKISARYGMLQPGDVVKCRVPHGKKKRKTCKRLIAYVGVGWGGVWWGECLWLMLLLVV